MDLCEYLIGLISRLEAYEYWQKKPTTLYDEKAESSAIVAKILLHFELMSLFIKSKPICRKGTVCIRDISPLFLEDLPVLV